jgi:hypothetical protein
MERLKQEQVKEELIRSIRLENSNAFIPYTKRYDELLPGTCPN